MTPRNIHLTLAGAAQTTSSPIVVDEIARRCVRRLLSLVARNFGTFRWSRREVTVAGAEKSSSAELRSSGEAARLKWKREYSSGHRRSDGSQ